MSVLPSVIVNATSKHTASLIFLHGLGDTGHGWSQGFSGLGINHLKSICPNASVIPVTLNARFRMPAWFDIYSLNPGEREDDEGIKSSAIEIRKLVEEEIKSGIPSERIVLGGFSQGGALALYTALTMEKTLGGILALSSWLPLHKEFPKCVKGNRDTPILQCHGDADPVVPCEFGEMSKSVLTSFCSKVEFKKYSGMAHSSSDQEMKDVMQWLNTVLPSN